MAKSFFILLRQLVVPAGVPDRHIAARAAVRLNVPVEDILSCQPVRRSLDARKRRGRAVYVYHVRVELPNKHRHALRKNPHLDIIFEKSSHHLSLNLTDPAPCKNAARPLVVGAGPAGLFAALRLARAGWNPLLIDRGDAANQRRSVVADFWRNGVLDTESNVLFGEGGAGLFSDGKLNTRHKDRQGLDEILGIMVAAGAPERIRIDAAPHVGSDLLGDVVAAMAEEIRQAGEIRYRCRLAGIHVENGRVRQAVLASDGKETVIPVSACILAVGHSARDVHSLLEQAGAHLEAKPFAIGLRVEMPQEQVDASQRGGSFSPAPGEAASFRLSRAPEGDAAACYTFCMCPGGLVIACASEPDMVCVNGMSFHARAGEYANAAFLTPVSDDDFAAVAQQDGNPALSGVAFQRHWERIAYQAGLAAGKYGVPASTLRDFVANTSGPLPDGRSIGRAAPVNLRTVLPEPVATTLAQSIPAMISRLRKVDPDRVLLYGVETRTSSPVRMVRDAGGEAVGVHGVFPAGEGSGYAGGIMTSALDGWKAAGALMQALSK